MSGDEGGKAGVREVALATARFDGKDPLLKNSNARLGWASDAMAETLRRLDVRFIALTPGASYRGLHDSLVNYLGNRDPQMMVCLHEEHAVGIAQGYAKITEKPMAVAVHSNVGLMHATMAVFNAWCARDPVLILGATGPGDAEERRPWIDWIHTSKDQGALIRHPAVHDQLGPRADKVDDLAPQRLPRLLGRHRRRPARPRGEPEHRAARQHEGPEYAHPHHSMHLSSELAYRFRIS